ncbi:MAG: GtrA family protein [Candidatus Promineifilaceae bacterium]|nr:GtrA family protein [Candidatus Promineifilaceae bacterium]
MMALFVDIVSNFGIPEREAERFFKFLIVGTVGFGVDFGLLTFLVEIVGLEPVVANTFSFSAAVVSNFTLNRYWTYPDSRSKRRRIQLLQFGMVSIIGLVINNLILFLLQHPFDGLLRAVHAPQGLDGYIPAKMVATIVVLFWNFFINRFWTYNDVD